MHIDCNQEELILIYPYLRDTLLALIKEDSELPLLGRKTILRRVGEAIKELHDKDWIHIGTAFQQSRNQRCEA
jgi:tRNA A-37 threonylcarbamoyl transferase component Bud32